MTSLEAASAPSSSTDLVTYFLHFSMYLFGLVLFIFSYKSLKRVIPSLNLQRRFRFLFSRKPHGENITKPGGAVDLEAQNLKPSGFHHDLLRGLQSTNFDIVSENIDKADARSGLNQEAAVQIGNIMRSQGVNFDRARLIYNQREMKKLGIDPRTGIPRDSRTVTFGKR
eukprot:Sdes_comp20906_c0_seq1m18116